VTIGRLTSSALTLAVGYSVAGALFWALLNVPESTVFALLASLLLTLSIVVLTGLTTAAAAAVAPGLPRLTVVRRAIAALPAFVVGLAIFAALWWLTAGVDDVWTRHRGEIDAMFIRYLGVTGTAPLHSAERWLTWTVRWGLGLSVVAALATSGWRGVRALTPALRTAIGWTPLAAVTVAAVTVAEGLWRVATWRPQWLPPSSIEVVFAAVKLGLLYLLFVIIAAAVLDIHRRAARRVLNL
jgi:hypothetical protein